MNDDNKTDDLKIINLETKIINYKKEKEKKVKIETLKWELTEEEMESTFQYNLLKTVLENHKLTNMDGNSKLMRQHIKTKMSGYKQQDINKNRFDKLNFVDYNYVVNLLINSELKCHYCANDIFVLYTFVRESKQWTLDRINNDIGHNKSNIVIACLECNLKRRRTNKDAFMFTKNLKITREGFS